MNIAGMIIGLVGKPSAGKSTFFKASTLADVEIANYPFTTIDPNSGIGYVKIRCVDQDFNKQCHPRMGSCIQHQRFIPVQLMDVAGLVPDAHLGKGRGNQFLDDLRQAHALIHVIDISGSMNAYGEPVDKGSYDPALDIKFLEVELDMWYLGVMKKGWERFARTIHQEKKDVAKALGAQLSGLGVTEDMIKDMISQLKLSEDLTKWTDVELEKLACALRKKTKPMVIAANKIDIPGAEANFKRLQEQFPAYKLVPCSGESEIALREASKKGLIAYTPGENTFTIQQPQLLNDKQKAALEFIKKNVLDIYGSTGVQTVLNYAVFDLLKYIAVYPGGVSKLEDSKGNCLPDCFLMPPKSTAVDFAYKLHTDFGKYFIRAINVKTKLPMGKDYHLQHGDVVEIVSGK